ncbi:hypothetical protein KKJ22_01050 [Xenorhabdus bovienii]|uniref:hypothetical protein n=1 Tax=Xenorhabdus bovienii TaxID=40576 RepID=UPI0023B2D372|nr:hypothetical protein [Xenorhabdus bovienii]MDE9496454.1 hypothetical protein [Xenorhabdus bovienii]
MGERLVISGIWVFGLKQDFDSKCFKRVSAANTVAVQVVAMLRFIAVLYWLLALCLKK